MMNNILLNDFYDKEWYEIFHKSKLKIKPSIIIDNHNIKKFANSIFPKSKFIDQRDAVRCKNFKEKKIHKKLNKLKPYELIGI